ncbi:hypothetical protein RJG79_00265 [Mycoplasmatota bacterium WC44]
MGLFNKKNNEILILDNLVGTFAEMLVKDDINFSMDPEINNEGYTKFNFDKKDSARVAAITDRLGITKHSSKVVEKKDNKLLKFFIKLYFLASILLILAITFAFIASKNWENMQFLQKYEFLTPELINNVLVYGSRIWIFNLGLSVLISVWVYAIEEEMNYTTKTTVYILGCNLIFFVIIIIIFRKLLHKKNNMLGPFGGVL